MAKRSSGQFARRKHDKYMTPPEAVLPLLPHLTGVARFIEPCAGDGRLIDTLELAGLVCTRAYDIEPQRAGIETLDALQFRPDVYEGTAFITNPPWTRAILHPLIVHLSDMAPTWLLFDADWIHTKQSRPYRGRLIDQVSVGRVQWIEGSKSTGKDNSTWYLFGPDKGRTYSRFFSR